MVDLRPGTPEHAKVLQYVKDRLETSERAMANFYPRWRVNERKMQAYISLPKYEELLKQMNDRGRPPKIVSLIMPYSFAVVQTVVTYLLHTFCGRQPMFQVGSYNGERAQQARNLEQMLQYNVDHTKLINQIYNALLNSLVYQVGVLRISWKEKTQKRTVYERVPTYSMFGVQTGDTPVPTLKDVLTYSGNEVESYDPFLFFPDPTVPMTKLAREGEYVFFRRYKSWMWCKGMEQQGVYRYVDAAPRAMPHNYNQSESDRAARSKGEAIAGARVDAESETTIRTLQLDEGTVDLIPKQLGLGPEEYPQRWLITLANKEVILRAVPLEADHGLHPVAVLEPFALGEAFGSISLLDVVGPVQDHISWLVNSHMQNVRGAINNRIIVNPHYVHMEDLRKDPDNDDGAWLVRMKQSAFGVKPAEGIFQLAVADVTSGNLKSVDMMIRMGHMFAGVNDNLMGLQDSTGRKTATEVRTAGEAGASRLAAMARLLSSQGLTDLPMMMGLNLQQRLNVEFYNRVLGGQKAGQSFIKGRDDIAGDFNFPINDGTLPLDRALLLTVWEKILQAVAADPQLRSEYSLPQIFAYVADLGGARNIETFKATVAPQPVIDEQVAAGNLVPTSAIAGATNV